MKKKLTQKRLKELLHYDPGTGELKRIKSKPGPVKKNGLAGTINENGYLIVTVDCIRYRGHRLAWLFFYGFFPENDIDHINRNRLDNRIKNLREVSRSCNLRNSDNSCNNTSGVKGVSWDSFGNSWKAQISTNYKNNYIGCFGIEDPGQPFDDAKAKTCNYGSTN